MRTTLFWAASNLDYPRLKMNKKSIFSFAETFSNFLWTYVAFTFCPSIWSVHDSRLASVAQANVSTRVWKSRLTSSFEPQTVVNNTQMTVGGGQKEGGPDKGRREGWGRLMRPGEEGGVVVRRMRRRKEADKGEPCRPPSALGETTSK